MAQQSKKRTLTFQTPKKKAMTPLRAAPVSKATKDSSKNSENSNPNLESRTNIKNEFFIENELIEAYREENAFLRNLKGDILLYNKFLGIKIEQEGSLIHFSIQRTSSSGKKQLDFCLEETKENYIFTLKETENCNIPEYFYDVIEFEKRVFPQFFYKAMQAVYEIRSNE